MKRVIVAIVFMSMFFAGCDLNPEGEKNSAEVVSSETRSGAVKYVYPKCSKESCSRTGSFMTQEKSVIYSYGSYTESLKAGDCLFCSSSYDHKCEYHKTIIAFECTSCKSVAQGEKRVHYRCFDFVTKPAFVIGADVIRKCKNTSCGRYNTALTVESKVVTDYVNQVATTKDCGYCDKNYNHTLCYRIMGIMMSCFECKEVSSIPSMYFSYVECID